MGAPPRLHERPSLTRLRAVLAAVSSIFATDAASTAVSVRRATRNDLEAIVALEDAAFSSDRVSRRQWRHHLESLSAGVLLAIGERRVVGAMLLLFRRGTRVARLYSIAVASGQRGRGIGERLLVAAERAARRRGANAIRLEVRVDNLAAQRLYERLGYARFGLRRGYYEDGADALRYCKPLS